LKSAYCDHWFILRLAAIKPLKMTLLVGWSPSDCLFDLLHLDELTDIEQYYLIGQHFGHAKLLKHPGKWPISEFHL
jgi:hypothetical protein